MTETLILVKIAGRNCALRASDVETVIDITEITNIPRAPAYVVGLTALRSQALTVLDSRIITGAQCDEFPTDQRGVVIEVDGYSYALLVDQVGEVGSMLNEVEQITGGFGSNWQSFAEGMVDSEIGPVLLLNARMLVTHPEQAVNAA